MATRKTADVREKELRLAIWRIERGRSHTKATELTISSVAREAGVTAALIHNHYPTVAEAVRLKQGASSRKQRDAKHAELAEERNTNSELRRQLEEARSQLARLATINEMLLVDNAALRAGQNTGNVVSIDGRRR
ncbi:TetR family transcriptional regulator [Variovorax sp. J22G73]|uniref:TetR family transcriptional regulator n=1 Tax=unclassified Variovorax TaxID=663243 RepID=UPI002576F658|nr:MULTISPECIES: TetR family transcriptional regulator [unclassified Variovorax]MDM0007489.1 TetR family transcriptional regulator [Variovorax sp. J22R203]MDM0100151.1 TetR family transcriptional regulator [Variovorax sp. J22G73]